MHVGLAAYLWHAGRDYRAAGVSTYIDRIVAHLVREPSGHTFTVFAGQDAPRIDGTGYCVIPLPTWRPAVRIAWEQLGLPVQARSRRLDLFHATVNVAPLIYSGPTVVTVHDLAFLRHPERFAWRKSQYLRLTVGRSARAARHVIAVSESTRSDVVELLRVPPERVSVVHLGVDDRFRGCLDSKKLEQGTSRRIGRPYILYVGTLEPRKNVGVLIGAYSRARSTMGFPHALVLVGAPGWMYEDLYRQVESLGLQKDVIFAGFVAPDELPLWYNDADLFVYPSAFEGFGLPLLEAMACGVPCITSQSSALVEVAGDACLTVEPGSEEDLQMAIVLLLGDGDLRALLRARGQDRASRFTWERAARETVRVYERAVESSPP